MEQQHPLPVDHARGAILCLAIVACAVAYSLRLLSFLHAKEAVLCVAVMGSAATVLARGRFSWSGVLAFSPLWMLLGLSSVIHLGMGRAAVLADTTTELARCAVLLLLGVCAYDLALRGIWRRRLLDAFLFSVAVAAFLGLVQYARLVPFFFPVFKDYPQRMYSVFGNQDLLGGYAALAVPIFAHRFLTRARPDILSLSGLVLVGAVALLSECRLAWLAVAGGILVILPGRQLSTSRLAGMGGALLLILAAGVWLNPARVGERIVSGLRLEDVGIRARIWFWDGAMRMARDHPIVGVGPGNFAYWSPRYLGEALAAPGGASRYHNELHTQHAHSEPLDVLTETGVIGLVCCSWMLARLIRASVKTPPDSGQDSNAGPFPASKEDPPIRALWGSLAALLVFSLANFPFHSAPHALAGVLLSAMVMARAQAGGAEPRDSRLPAYLLPLFGVAVSGFILWSVIWPSYLLRKADAVCLDSGDALTQYSRAVSHPWPNALARHNYGIALIQARRYIEAEEQFRLALRGLDTGQVYLALGALTEMNGEAEKARERFEECLYRIPSSFAAWKSLIRLSPIEEEAQIMARARPWLTDTDYARLETAKENGD